MLETVDNSIRELQAGDNCRLKLSWSPFRLRGTGALVARLANPERWRFRVFGSMESRKGVSDHVVDVCARGELARKEGEAGWNSFIFVFECGAGVG